MLGLRTANLLVCLADGEQRIDKVEAGGHMLLPQLAVQCEGPRPEAAVGARGDDGVVRVGVRPPPSTAGNLGLLPTCSRQETPHVA